MSVLSQEEIAELRQAVADLFPDRAKVLRRTSARSPYGGSTPTYTIAQDDVPVLFGLRSATELARLATADVQVDQLFTFPGGTDIRQDDRIEAGGRTWDVVSVGGGGSWEVTLPVAARETS